MKRGIEIEGSLTDGPNSVITRQVSHDVAMCVAVPERVGKTLALQ